MFISRREVKIKCAVKQPGKQPHPCAIVKNTEQANGEKTKEEEASVCTGDV